jgi:hypothetical protein
MIIFPDGIVITKVEHTCLLYLVADPDAWVHAVLQEYADFCRDKLCEKWMPSLLLDPEVTDLPAAMDALAEVITARPDYRSRRQRDAELPEPEEPSFDHLKLYAAKARGGATVTICLGGIDLSDLGCHCILSRAQDIDDFVMGGLLGKIDKGKGMMKRQYLPILMNDLSVNTFPADDDGLIAVITARPDYQTLPEQLAAQEANDG